MKKVEQKHGIPALISLMFPGLGQIIKGHVGKGLFIIIGMVFSFIAMLVLIGLITTPLFWVWNIYDAYNAN